MPPGCVRDPNDDPITISLAEAKGGTVERVNGVWWFVPAPRSTAPGSFMLYASDGALSAKPQRVTVTIREGAREGHARGEGRRQARAPSPAERRCASPVRPSTRGTAVAISWSFGDGTTGARGTSVAHRFKRVGTFTVTARAQNETKRVTVRVRRRAVELAGPPRVVDGVLTVRVRTRVAGRLSVRADSRSRTIKVKAGSAEHSCACR